ncbi:MULTISPECIES: response regulator [Cohnella]|uniref:response regulator n=1 Tax=Cohnella TaxID=329857 RepID=UPI0009B95EE8|nr:MULTISPECIES: response regulator [Cohnella]MBN2981915.1 response regulator [Cohnella algarum]
MARILIADDSAVMRATLKSILTKAGHAIAAEAFNGREAVEMYERFRPDLVTMDVMMPEMDGIAAIRHICEFDPRARIVVLSTMERQETIAEAIRAGAKEFITKPFIEQRVVHIVGHVLGR